MAQPYDEDDGSFEEEEDYNGLLPEIREQIAETPEQIPETIKRFIQVFRSSLADPRAAELYESSFPKLTEMFYKHSPWPVAGLVAPLVDNDTVFLMLYRELYYRHLSANLQPTLQQRIDSWDNYKSLFSYFLSPAMALEHIPNSWLWDMIDEFVFQFQSFRQFLARSYAALSPEERKALQDDNSVWNPRWVMFYLNEFIVKANVLQSEGASSSSSSSSSSSAAIISIDSRILRTLGCFATIGLSRVHCLLGDYFMTLKTLELLEFNRKGFHTRVTSCHASFYYNLGFAYLMSRRYVEAIKAFSFIIGRLRSGHPRGSQGDQISKTSDRMQALLAIAISLCPQRLEESLHNALWDAYGEKMTRMQRGDLGAFAELFDFAAPKFVSAANSDAHSAEAQAAEPAPSETVRKNRATRVQSKVFLNEISQQIYIPIIRSYLKLYTTIDVSKLAHFLDLDVKQITQHLLSFKHKTRRVVSSSSSAAPAHPQPSSSDLRFFFSQDMIHISSDKGPRRFSAYYIRQIHKFDQILRDLQGKQGAL